MIRRRHNLTLTTGVRSHISVITREKCSQHFRSSPFIAVNKNKDNKTLKEVLNFSHLGRFRSASIGGCKGDIPIHCKQFIFLKLIWKAKDPFDNHFINFTCITLHGFFFLFFFFPPSYHCHMLPGKVWRSRYKKFILKADS